MDLSTIVIAIASEIRVVRKAIKGAVMKMIEPVVSPLRNRIRVRIPTDSHLVWAGDATKQFQFMAIVDNPNRFRITLVGTDTRVFNHDIELVHIASNDETEIPRETLDRKIVLAVFKPIMCATNLPVVNSSWMLKSVIRFSCWFGDVRVQAESPYFKLPCDDWDAVRQYVLSKKEDPSS